MHSNLSHLDIKLVSISVIFPKVNKEMTETETEGVNVKDEHRREVPLPDQRRRRRRDASHHGQHRPRRPVLHSGEAVVHVPEMPLAAADPPLIQVRWGV